MSLNIEIIKISQIEEQNIDYKTVVFKILMPKRVTLEFSRENWVILKTLIDGGVSKLFVDFRETDYIDSAGISVLVRAAKLLRSKKGSIAIANVSQEMLVIFKMINLNNLIDIFPTDVEAMNSFRYL
jgi:anti-sigma B factor antagonist